MNELSIEQKAKRYDEALERARTWRDKSGMPKDKQGILDDIFPELAESEDEKMRKWIINYLDNRILNSPISEEKKACTDAITWLKKQGEQKHVVIIPNFKVGDWIVFNGLTLYVKEVVKGFYRTIARNGVTNSYDWDIDNVTRLWTIADAKDGDVLVVNNNVFIYAHRKQMYPIAVAHCFVDEVDVFHFDGEFGYTEKGNSIHPATKEQRDTFFAKMKEAGYVWDADKKELKEIKQKSTDNANKVEPRFKVGVWVVYDGWVCQIIDVTEDGYCNSKHGFIPKDREDSMHLWTIADAKDGDVLVASDKSLFIYDGSINENAGAGFHIAFTEDMDIILNSDDGCGWEEKDSCHPATKEQCDLLFQKMKEAGYVWDAEKKELKKIPNAFEECEIVHVEHGKYYYCIKDYYAGGNKRASKGDVVQALNGMNMMALGAKANEYFIPVNTIKQMSTWSEEDETTTTNIIIMLKEGASLHFNKKDIAKSVDWLKSLRPRSHWKPSDVQMERLYKYAEQNNYDGFILTSLYQELKKLKENIII